MIVLKVMMVDSSQFFFVLSAPGITVGPTRKAKQKKNEQVGY